MLSQIEKAWISWEFRINLAIFDHHLITLADFSSVKQMILMISAIDLLKTKIIGGK